MATRYAKRDGCGSVNASDTYVEIRTSVSYPRIIDLPAAPVVSLSFSNSFILVVVPSSESHPVVQYLEF